MTAPSSPGIYYYKVFGQSGPTGAGGFSGFALYSIAVSSVSTATPTSVPPTSTRTPVPSTSTAVPPTATSTDVASSPITSLLGFAAAQHSAVRQGEGLYKQYCASCHEPSATAFVHETVYGESREDIVEAIR